MAEYEVGLLINFEKDRLIRSTRVQFSTFLKNFLANLPTYFYIDLPIKKVDCFYEFYLIGSR